MDRVLLDAPRPRDYDQTFSNSQLNDLVVNLAQLHHCTVTSGSSPETALFFKIQSKYPLFDPHLFVDQLSLQTCCDFTHHTTFKTQSGESLFYKCRHYGKVRESRVNCGNRDLAVPTQPRLDTSTNQFSCTATVSILQKTNNSFTIKANLSHKGHLPGSNTDLHKLPLRTPIREETLRLAKYNRDHFCLSEQVGAWKAKYFTRISYRPFDSLDGRFEVASKDMSNALESVKLASRLHSSDMRSTFYFLQTLPNTYSWCFRGSMCGTIVYTNSPVVEMVQACLVSVGGRGNPILSEHNVLVDNTEELILKGGYDAPDSAGERDGSCETSISKYHLRALRRTRTCLIVRVGVL